MSDGHYPPFSPLLPSTARIYDFLAGGKDNYDADRYVAEKLIAGYPQLRAAVRLAHWFALRAAEWLSHIGIEQFADLGTGVPRMPYLHERVPNKRVVYVDNDRVVAAHGRALLEQWPTSRFVYADFTATAEFTEKLSSALDLTQPVAVMLGLVLDFLPRPAAVIKMLAEVLAPGSCLVISHIAADLSPHARGMQSVFSDHGTDFFPRTHDELAALLTGHTLINPGLVPVDLWIPTDANTDRSPTQSKDPVACYGVVAQL
ncbi:SAM-dependent methyltransferase [Nocardia sp. NPDC059239]|uniref:SAM-dependent methyltransferase n=1 Tax=Nocardia sp. NPDC059239 TaxID=3346785 RepID=UPI003686EDAF